MIKKLFLGYVLLCTSIISFCQESYYNGIDFSDLGGIDLKDALATRIISTHTNFLSYTPGVWEASKATDLNPSNSDQVILIYGWEGGFDTDITNDKFRDKSLRDNGSNGAYVWNREHVFSKSLGNPNLGTSGPGSDAHHLRPADRSRNTERSNLPFAAGTGNSQKVNDGSAWYPGDEWKGDVARMMMYMYVRYSNVCLPTNVGVGDSSNTPDAMIDLFLHWNIEDPVSEMERGRNTYHEDTSNGSAQGNRNPFIDNPYLATRIWGGGDAQDLWGIFISGDSESPTSPQNVIASNQTTTSIDLSWTASSDNVAVTGYNIYFDGVLKTETATASIQIGNLIPGTSYGIEIEAKDQYNNKSDKSSEIQAATTQDTTAPSVPLNLTASNVSGTGFKISWTASTDDTAVVGYDIFVDGNLNTSTTSLSKTITGLSTSTEYLISVLAKDATNNLSAQSAALSVTTSDGLSNGVTELFFSEYAEGTAYNKALEIMNATSDIISLAGYALKKSTNGAGVWANELLLDSGTIKNINADDVFVLVNTAAEDDDLLDNADLLDSGTINFNGDDVLGLFKNDELIDVIGDINADRNDFAKDFTLRRKASVVFPNTTFEYNSDTASNLGEWDTYPTNTFSDIGNHSVTLSAEEYVFSSFKMFPNPASSSKVFFSIENEAKINIYNILGELVQIEKISKSNNSIYIGDLASGVYIIKGRIGNQFISKKLIKI